MRGNRLKAYIYRFIFTHCPKDWGDRQTGKPPWGRDSTTVAFRGFTNYLSAGNGTCPAQIISKAEQIQVKGRGTSGNIHNPYRVHFI